MAYNFDQDLKRWIDYAMRIHSRNIGVRDKYVMLQSIPENHAHRWVARRTQNHKAVLEIGIGGGEHLRFQDQQTVHQRYVGVDLSYEHAALCRRQFPIHILTAAGEDLPFKSSSFDCCIALGVLEHVLNLDQLLVEIKRVVTAGGECFFVVPTNGSLAIAIFRQLVTYPSLQRRGIQRPDYIWHYENVNSFKRMMALITRHLEITTCRPFPLRFIPWWLSPLYGIHCGNL